jgi:transposase
MSGFPFASSAIFKNYERKSLIIPKRDMESLKRWLARLKSPEIVEAATMDLWNPYRLAIREVLPHACVIADKYHVLRMANDVVETVRNLSAQAGPQNSAETGT